MHILIAPNAFKNSISATDAADAIKQGLYSSGLLFTCEGFPIGDGGDGTAELLIKKFDGLNIYTKVHDPLGRIIETSFGLIENGKTAIIEMANASGLRLLPHHELAALKASSYGTGELVKKALDFGARKIIIGMGGSATVDGGCGILKALGVDFLDEQGESLPGTPENMVKLHEINLTHLDPRLRNCEIIILCDVNNKLLGENGAAKIFGPQKGASTNEVLVLESALEKLAQTGLRQFGKDISKIEYGGTAGGAAAGLFLVVNAQLKKGIDYFLQFTEFDIPLNRAHLVITGEGSIDEQTLEGKGPFGIAERAKKKQLPVIGIAGKVPMEESENLKHYFDALFPINHEAIPLVDALLLTKENLIRTSRQLGRVLKMKTAF